ncbi:hypothetical protein [Acidithiobacillus ferrooxidans]|nr:hypothetical protein [Acidithiobacillus ferrooxidans]
MDARIRKQNAEWIESQEASMREQMNNQSSGGYGGYGGGVQVSPQVARAIAKILLWLFLAGAVFSVIATIVMGTQQKMQMDAVAAKKAAIVAAEAAHQKKLLENRKPFHYHGYTLYSDTSPADRYLDFHITNVAGKTIWTQPAWMDDKIVSESRPMADVTAKYYLHPGQIKFVILANGANKNLYMYTVCIGHHGQITWASPYHAPYKNQWRYHPVVILPHQ